jgi:hypothetical protein
LIGVKPRLANARITPSAIVSDRLSTVTWLCSCGCCARLVEWSQRIQDNPLACR